MERYINQKKHSLLEYALWYLVAYTFLGYIYKTTTFNLRIMVYASFVFLVIVFGVYFLKGSRSIRIPSVIAWWVPYLLLTIFGYFLKGDFEHFSYWLICLLLICRGRQYNVEKCFPYKLIFNLGIFFLIGIAVQITLPNFYNTHIATLFTNSDQVIYWGRAYGFAGFAYQLDVTAVPLLYAEGIYLFYLSSNNKAKMWKKCFVVGLFILGVLLTGKRMMVILAVLAPVIVYVISRKILGKRLITLLCLAVVLGVGLLYLYYNAEHLLASNVFRRIAKTFVDLKSGIDISSGRTELYDIAMTAFRNNPFFGIGIGNFTKLEGAYTATHNTYFQVLCEQGLVGLVLYIIPLITLLIATIKKLRTSIGSKNISSLKVSLYIQLVYILYSLSGNTNINMFGYIMYFISIAILAQAYSYRREAGE